MVERWSFPSKDHGEIEGYANPGLEMFKGNPLQALAREICQNSLDAALSDKPVIVVFEHLYVPINEFPGMHQLKRIISLCSDFWNENANKKTEIFLNNAKKECQKGKICVLRISDYNTKGLSGAFADGKKITPWVKLVKGNAISTKEGDSAGSYGIGKAAAFVNSAFQTVFYRTWSKEDNIRAVQGVARLMSFEDKSEGMLDPIRRAVGYYGNPENNMPLNSIGYLDKLNLREEYGTDVFIPGFTGVTADGKWVAKMIGAILDSFLISIHSGKLIVKIAGKTIDKDTLPYIVAQHEKVAKDAAHFNKALIYKEKTIVDQLDFHNLGQLRLSLLYESNLHKKILIVRKTGMKIAEIPGLPKSISYTGILELEGYGLNAFFRDMENPEHNRWEPKRHPEPELAKEYKSEIETWVKRKINEHIESMAGTEIDIDTGDLFKTQKKTTEEISDKQKEENVVDTVKSVEIIVVEKKPKTIEKTGARGNIKSKGTTTEDGRFPSIRSKTGTKPLKPGKPAGKPDAKGKDQVLKGMRQVQAKSRALVSSEGKYTLYVEATRDINNGQIEVISTGENGKGLTFDIKKACVGGKTISCVDGKIRVGDIPEGEKVKVTFEIPDKHQYALGVKVYGD